MANIDITPGFRKSAVIRLRGASDLVYPSPGLSPENTEILENINITHTLTYNLTQEELTKFGCI